MLLNLSFFIYINILFFIFNLYYAIVKIKDSKMEDEIKKEQTIEKKSSLLKKSF